MNPRSNLHLLDGADLSRLLDQVTEHRTGQQVVEAVLAELGKEYEPMPQRVLVRTDPPLRVSPGGILLTDKESNLWFGQGHNRVVKATVIAAGKKTSYLPGERICFQRLHFAWLQLLKDGTYFGCIANHQVVGYIDEELPADSRSQECLTERNGTNP